MSRIGKEDYHLLSSPIRDMTVELYAAEAGVDFAEGAADHRAEDNQSRNNNDSYQNKN